MAEKKEEKKKGQRPKTGTPGPSEAKNRYITIWTKGKARGVHFLLDVKTYPDQV